MTADGVINLSSASKWMICCFSSIPRFRRHWVTFLPAVMKQGVGLVDVVVDVTKVKEVTPSKRGPKMLKVWAEQVDDCNATSSNSWIHNLGIVKYITMIIREGRLNKVNELQRVWRYNDFNRTFYFFLCCFGKAYSYSLFHDSSFMRNQFKISKTTVFAQFLRLRNLPTYDMS